MQQALLITAYKDVLQLKDLLMAFDDNFFFYIHFDKKSYISQKEMDEILNMRNVVCFSRKYEVRWGGVNHLKAILFLLKKAFENPRIEYFHLITGQDYPIKKPTQISSFLEQCDKTEFLTYNKFPYPAWSNGGMDRLLYYSFFDLFNGREGLGRFAVLSIRKIQIWLGLKRGFSSDFPSLYGGGTYWTLTRGCIEYVLKYIEGHQNYVKRFQYTFCSEEIFFQTIILNSPFAPKVVNNNLRFIVWDKMRENFPAILDERDEKTLLASGALFARKLDLLKSKSLLEKLKMDTKIEE